MGCELADEPTNRQLLQNRYVSKGEYIVNISKRLSLQLMVLVFWLIGGSTAMLSIILVGCLVYVVEGSRPSMWIFRLELLVASLITTLVCIGCWWLSNIFQKKSKSVDSGVLITKAAMTKLPVEEVLIRSSEMPAQYQQEVLLRSAESRDMSSEELLRPNQTNTHSTGYYEQPQSDQNSITIQC